MSTDIVIVAAARTARRQVRRHARQDPGRRTRRRRHPELLKRAKLSGDQIGEVILGQVLTAGVGQNPARQAVIKSRPAARRCRR